jgi:tetratricopeptide (TPR) repeat protein
VILAFLALAAVQTASPPAAAPPSTQAPVANPEEARLRACAGLARTDPERAVQQAQTWMGQQGGLPARQCLGLALVALQRWASAANVYEQSAREAESRNQSVRADLWVQAANAWLAAGESDRALQAIESALATPNLTTELRGEALIDRARAQVALGHADIARQDIDRALQQVPADPFAWYLSAALARRENNLARAQADIAHAAQLAPDDPDVTLLSGTIAGQAGNMAEAERLYRRVVQSAPDSEAGRAAAASLATMREVEVPAPATPAPAASAQPAPTQPAQTPPHP